LTSGAWDDARRRHPWSQCWPAANPQSDSTNWIDGARDFGGIAWIAGTALAYGATLVGRERAFSRVPRLDYLTF
jgi:hypothetical protein